MRDLALLLLTLLIIGCSSQTESPKLISVNGDELTEVLNEKKNSEKALLVNVWATWCGPCVEEFPAIVHLAEYYEDDLEVMFISGDFPKDTVRVKKFLDNHGVDWDTYLKEGSEYTFIQSLHNDWSGALPFTVIYNKQGEEVTHWENKADSVIFDSYIQQAIK